MSYFTIIRKLARIKKAQLKLRLKEIPKDPVVFSHDWLQVKAFHYQRKLAEAFMKPYLTIVVRWTRQSGKSFFIALLLVWYALKHPGVAIGIVGPSLRQSKLYIQRINGLLLRIGRQYYEWPQRKTIVRFKNGSLIEAFPNNPETCLLYTSDAADE
mgnify:FL=1